jgi:hypothetical protein
MKAAILNLAIKWRELFEVLLYSDFYLEEKA